MKLKANHRRVLDRADRKGVVRENKRTGRVTLSDILAERGFLVRGVSYGFWQDYHLTDAGREALASAK